MDQGMDGDQMDAVASGGESGKKGSYRNTREGYRWSEGVEGEGGEKVAGIECVRKVGCYTLYPEHEKLQRAPLRAFASSPP